MIGLRSDYNSMKHTCSFEQLEEHIFPRVIESYNINVIQKALFLSHLSSYIREVICEVTSVDCTCLDVQGQQSTSYTQSLYLKGKIRQDASCECFVIDRIQRLQAGEDIWRRLLWIKHCCNFKILTYIGM